MRPGVDALRELPVFAALTADQQSFLNEAGDLARVGPEEEILPQGQVPTELIFLVSGAAVTTHANGDGGGTCTDVIVPTTAIACAEAIMGLPSLTGVRTIASSRLIIIPIAPLRAMIEQDADLARRFLNHALQELHHLQAEASELKLCSSAQRLARYLLALAEDTNTSPARFVLPFEKRYLAGKIGCSQENLSRAFAALRRYGVETQRGIVVLKDAGGLRDFAGL